MFPNIKNDLMYILNIVEWIEKIHLYSKNCNDADEFYKLNEQLNFNACLTLLANIGETVVKLSPQLKNKYPTIEWKDIRAFRNKVVHDYPGLDIYIVYDIITSDLAPLEENLIKMLSAELSTGNFILEEFKVAEEDNKYYKHIPFDKIEILTEKEEDKSEE